MQFFSHLETHAPRKRPQDSFLHRILSDPYLDWFYMIVIVLILAGVYIGIGFLTYVNMKERLAAGSTPNNAGNSGIFSAETLSRTLKDFDAHAAERARIIRGYSDTGDPSL